MPEKTKDQLIDELRQHQKLLETKLRHLSNDLAMTRHEYEIAANKHLELMKNLEGTNAELERKNQLITDQNFEIREQRNELKTQYRFLQILLDDIPNPIFYKNRNGVYIGCNKAFKSFFGRKEEEIIGRTEYDFFSSDLADLYTEQDRELMASSGIQHYEAKVLNKDGDLHDIIYNKTVFYDLEGRVAGIIGVMEDITKVRQAHKALEESEKNLQEANVAKDKFFSIIAHALKNPLNALLLTSEFLSQKITTLPPEKQQSMINNMTDSTKRLSNLLEDLLTWARTQVGKMPFFPEQINLKQIVEECIELYETNIQDKELDAINLLEEGDYAFADKNMVRTIIRNLISNAIKFTHREGKVTISRMESEDYVEVIVEDTGVGICEEDRQNLFRIDSHFTTRGTENESGTGLGLLLCNEFAEKNRGRLAVESEEGKGSRFLVILPRREI